MRVERIEQEQGFDTLALLQIPSHHSIFLSVFFFLPLTSALPANISQQRQARMIHSSAGGEASCCN